MIRFSRRSWIALLSSLLFTIFLFRRSFSVTVLSTDQTPTDISIKDHPIANGLIDPFIEYARSPPTEYPFLRHKLEHRTDESRGILLSVGKPQVAFAVHAIGCIRFVHNSTLPILIAYAGGHDLPKNIRTYLGNLASGISFLNIMDHINDKYIHMKRFTIKPFALLLSPFQHTMMIDADVIFIQDPARLFEEPDYLQTGTFFFHDRLVLKDVASKRFRQRQQWYHALLDNEFHQPSQQLTESRMWTEKYAEEQDSGLVMVDYGHRSIDQGVLFAAWMHTIPNRKILHKKTYGDKESYWLAFELLNIPYHFEPQYGGVIGSLMEEGDQLKVCGNTILHSNSEKELLWFNGSLLRNYHVDRNVFGEFTHYMYDDGTWHRKPGWRSMMDGFCMIKGEVHGVSMADQPILKRSIEIAQEMDAKLKTQSWYSP